MALTHPWFLLGLLATAIPVLIHLFELRRPKRVLFTNVGFIREVRLVTARQRKIKHLLILLARIGFVTFLVLMFVQPYIPALHESNRTQTAVGVIVDASASMQAGEMDQQSYFDQAISQAHELPTAYPAGMRFVVGDETRTPLTADAYRTSLDKLTISGRSTGLRNTLARLEARPSQVEQVFIFSDFQKSAFSKLSTHKWDSTKQVFLVPLAGAETRNVFVDSVWLDDAFVRSNTDVILHLRLRNGGSTPIDNCQVKLFIGERQATAFSVDVPTTAPTTMTARVRLTGEQLQQCRVELEDYPVTFDNTYYFSLQSSPRIQVMDVGTGGVEATQRLYANEPLFSYTNTTPASLNYRLLEKANLVVVQGQPRIEAGLREGLKRMVQRGGSVVIIPTAEAAGRASYDQLFRDLGMGPVQWEPVNTRPVLREVAMPDRRNPFFRDVFGAQSRQPVTPKAAPVLRWSRSGTDILRMQDGDGFLAGFGNGKGKVYLFAAPFDEAHTDFTQHALFVPVMYRLAMQSYQRDQQPAYRLNQGTVAVNVENATDGGEQVYKLTKDSLSFIPAQRMQAGTLRFDVPAGMQAPGFYKLTRDKRPIATLAFNHDKRESELAAYSAAELRQLIGPDQKNVQVYDARQGESVAARYKAERVGTPLWQYCLWAALACLLAEVLLLRFLNRPKTAEPVAVAA